MAYSNQVKRGAACSIATQIENGPEVNNALLVASANVSSVKVQALMAIKSSTANGSSIIASPKTKSVKEKNTSNVKPRNTVFDNHNDQKDSDNEDEDDAASTVSTNSDSSIISNASSNPGLVTQLKMGLLAEQVRRTLNEVVAAEKSVAAIAGYDFFNIAGDLEKTTTQILASYMTMCKLYEQQQDDSDTDDDSGPEMSATIRSVIARYPTLRGRCGL
ncbi:uncharacterized protein PADG_00031 [Paracoccidioides brasiliensis Pb18]|uniref:Uncharacterized protein n=1 Tax=Paracoccidioides brasiliensis (strain Pb18) TaxID=502780 RepID=C1FZJ1_PARBD|nr:uncharacterized protein PADG_00031 [Paracoccidioides brasiliensis Pb18]EEH43742.1 hypothetical protein PADG_00031 [Paracoccidioides brasiliensis Pb18]